MIKLFMSGFPLDISELDIARLIAPHGDLETIKIVRDRKYGKCKGYAFVEMKDEAGANRAIAALHDQPSGDRLLTLKIATEPQVISIKSKTNAERPAHPYVKVARPGETIRNKRPRKVFQVTDPSRKAF
ncbi:RNA recognition motif domain-containing protein [Mucilaginibacter sp. NFX135]|uniref:RNA recognition motif domain-containing protein n=1 Tax=Mucilaginibacter sp. NFX135 TaxID=3402687 RepID=UPI003AFA9D4A